MNCPRKRWLIASENESSEEEFEVTEPSSRLLVQRKIVKVIPSREDFEEEKKLNEDLSASGMDVAGMTKEEKRQIVEAVRTSRKEFAQEQSQERDVTARSRRIDANRNSDGKALTTQNIATQSGSRESIETLPDVDNDTKRLRLRRRGPISAEKTKSDNAGGSNRKRASAVVPSKSEKVLKTAGESRIQLDQNQNSNDGADCYVGLFERVRLMSRYDCTDHIRDHIKDHVAASDACLPRDGATIKEDRESSDDDSVIFEMTKLSKEDKSQCRAGGMSAKTLFKPDSSEMLFSGSQTIGSQHDSSQQKHLVEQSHDHDSDDTQDPFNSNSLDGGATSQVMTGGHSCRHGNNSQGSIWTSKEDGISRQKRKLVQKEDGPSAKRPDLWAHLLLDHLDDKNLEETASELPPRKLLNKWAQKRKLGESCHYFAPQGVTTGQVVQRILEFLKDDQATLRRLQDSSAVMVTWGPPVIAGCHKTDTIWRAERDRSVDRDASLVGVGKRLRCHDAKVDAPNSDALLMVKENGDSPRLILDSDSHHSDDDFDWLPDLKDHGKKRRQTTKRVTEKPTTKRVVDKDKPTTKRVVEKLEPEGNVESVPDTPPGWIKSPAALKAETAGKSKVSEKQMLHEATLNSILMQGQAKVTVSANKRLGVSKQPQVVKRKPRQNEGGKRRVKRKGQIPLNMFTDDNDSSGDDCDARMNCGNGNGHGDTGKDVRFKARVDKHSTVDSAEHSCDVYFKPVAKVHRKPRAGVLDKTAEGVGNHIEVNAVFMETRVSPSGRVIAAVANIAHSIVAGATSLLRVKAMAGNTVDGTLVGSQRELTEISSGEDEGLGEAHHEQHHEQQQNQQQQQLQQKQNQQHQQQQQQQNQQPEAQQQQQHQRKQRDGEMELEQKDSCHQQELVNCPMCFQYFPPEGIEEHAFSCQGEPAPSVSRKQVAPLDGATVGNESPIFRHTRRPLRQYGRQTRNQGDATFDIALGDSMEPSSSKQSKDSTAICDVKRSSSPEDVEILFHSDLSATPSKRRKGNAGQDEQVEPMKCQSCPICSKSFRQSLIEAHVVRCLESAETDKRTTRSKSEPNLTGGHLDDDGFDENMPINARKRQTYLKERQKQPLITSKLMVKDTCSTGDTFRRYSSVVNTLKSASDHHSDSDSSSSASLNFSDDHNEDHPVAVHAGMSRPRTSPLRTFQRISDQGNAVLDYHNQFRKGDVEKARRKSESRASNSKWRSGKRKGKRKKKASPKKKNK